MVRGEGMKRLVSIVLAAFFILSVPLFALNFDGSGTQSDPYIIKNKADWDTFVANTNSGNDLDKYYELSDEFDNHDDPVTQMACNVDYYAFGGTLNGNGRTLTINISTTLKDSGPIRYVNNATFLNLTIEGSISTSNMDAGGLSGRSKGNTKIQNCVSKVEIISSVNGDGTHGGFIGITDDGLLEFASSIFCGKFIGSSTNCCSGFVGYRGGSSKINYYNCVFDPEEITFLNNNSAVFNRNVDVNRQVFSNCYYTLVFGEEIKGEDATTITKQELCSLLGEEWSLTEGKLLPFQSNYSFSTTKISNIDEFIIYTGNNLIIEPVVEDIYGNKLLKNTDYRLDFYDSKETALPNVLEKDHYVLKIVGIGNYKGFQIKNFVVAFSGTGTQEDPVVISTEYDWLVFVDWLQKSNLAGQYFKLGADLDFGGVDGAFICAANGNNFEDGQITTSVYPEFDGFFDGDNHYMSGIYSDGRGDGVFSKVGPDGEVRNLIVKNSYFKSGCRCSALVGINRGKIINCHVENDVFVYSSRVPNSTESSSQNCHGGIVGYNDSIGIISGCTCGATVYSRHRENSGYGGIVGINKGTVKHCLYFGNSVYATSGYYGAICGEDRGTITLCLHTCSSLGAINSSNSDKATFAYSLSLKNPDISFYSDSEDVISYGLVKAEFDTLVAGNTLYAPQGKTLNLNFMGTDIIQDIQNFNYDYKYLDGGTIITETCTKNDDGTYSIVMPAADVSLYAGYGWEGEGTEENPYKIINLYQLNFLAKRVNELKKTYSGKIFVLQNDIQVDSSQNNYTPIGAVIDGETCDFCGAFDGAGHSISGINIYTAEAPVNADYTGLFGLLGTDGVIENLILKNSTIKGDFSTGAIAGYNKGTINNCSVEKDVLVCAIKTDATCHGGITGYNEGTINNCTGAAQVKNYSRAGGITGYNNGGTINQCFYFEENNDYINSKNYAGCITGQDQGGTLTNNLYVSKSLLGTGTAASSKDITGITKIYAINGNSSYNISPVFSDSNCGVVYNSKLYSAQGTTVSLFLGSYNIPSNCLIGLTAQDDTKDNFVFESQSNGIYTFTMPDYDITITPLAKIDFNTNGGAAIQSKYLLPGSKLLQVQNPSVLDGAVFDGWYTNPDFTQAFDFSTEINSNLTLYAKYSAGIELTAIQDAYTPGVFYTSFYDNQNSYKAGEGTKIFYVIKTAGGKLLLEQEESGIINAGQAVIIQSTQENIPLVYTDKTGSYLYGNILKGTQTQITAPEGSYVLTFGTKGGVGFYKWTGTIDANKAYFVEADDE